MFAANNVGNDVQCKYKGRLLERCREHCVCNYILK